MGARMTKRVTHADITLERGSFPMGGWEASWIANDGDGFDYFKRVRLLGYTKKEARRVAHAIANGRDYI